MTIHNFLIDGESRTGGLHAVFRVRIEKDRQLGKARPGGTKKPVPLGLVKRDQPGFKRIENPVAQNVVGRLELLAAPHMKRRDRREPNRLGREEGVFFHRSPAKDALTGSIGA